MGNQIIASGVAGLIGLVFAFQAFWSFTKGRHLKPLVTTSAGLLYLFGRGIIPAISTWLLSIRQNSHSIEDEVKLIFLSFSSVEVFLRVIPVLTTTSHRDRQRFVKLLSWIQAYLFKASMTQAQRRRAKKTKESVALLGNASFPKFCRLLKNEVTLLTSQTEQRAVNRAIKDLYDNYHDETDAHDMSQEELDRVYLKMMVYRLNNELGGDSVRLLLETIATELRRFDPS